MRTVLLSCLIVIAGCNPSSGGPHPATADALFTGLVQALCDLQVKCGNIGASERAVCVSRAGLLVASIDYDSLIASGKVVFDAGAAATCLGFAQGLTCQGTAALNLGTACAAALKGTVAIGGACTTTNECANGSCLNTTGGCSGVCTAYTAVGGACNDTVASCDPSAFCDTTTMTCLTPAGAGKACADISQCSAGLACADGVCVTPLGAGAACDGITKLCGSNLVCDGDSMTCVALAASGALCANILGCKDGLTCVGYESSTPNSMGMCAAWLDAGATCTPGEQITGCPQDMACNATSMKCTPLGAADGVACTMGNDCQSMLCDPGTMKCTEPLALGAACTPPDDGATDACGIGACDPTSKTCKLSCM